MAQAQKITDHEKIKRWAEARGGRPSRVKGTVKGDSAVLRFDFGRDDEALEPLEWDEFFSVFEENNLALLEQEETASGKPSRFSKFVHR
ncbi:MAG TPA: hypothetical protein VL356_03645 [Acidocella sp.]|nr:hypothetical protein [Acidocella sp.]